MNREIKFRQFIDGEFHYWGFGLPDMGNGFVGPALHYESEQYTGRKSIDNQEVYDGDLLRFPDTEQLYEVRWDNEEGAWGVFLGKVNFYKIGVVEMMQVAGNRYENKDELYN